MPRAFGRKVSFADEHPPLALRVRLGVTTLVPFRTAPALGRPKAERDAISNPVTIDVGADHAAGTGAGRTLGVDLEVGHREAGRVAAAAGRHPGDHGRLPVAEHIDPGAGLAAAAGLIHHQIGRLRLAGRLLLRQRGDGRLTIRRAANQGDTSTDARGGDADHGVGAEHGRAAIVVAKGGLAVDGAGDAGCAPVSVDGPGAARRVGRYLPG
jgi:hypothetical protein